MNRLLPWQYHLLLLVGLLSFSASAFAQKDKPLPGYVVTAGGDTLRGAIRRSNRVAQQYQAEFIPTQGHQLLFLDGYQLASYTYFTNRDTVRYVSLLFSQFGGKLVRGFLRQIVGGEVQLYYYNSSPTLQGTTIFTYRRPDSRYPIFGNLNGYNGRLGVEHTIVVYRQNQSRLEDISRWKFPQDAVSYFADYPDLVADLRAGRYRAHDLPQIVRRYNAFHRLAKSAP